jgi:hypothetical protein
MALEGKISIKHYLNKRLKPLEGDRYPLYVQVIVKKKHTEFKSSVGYQHLYLTDLQFNRALENNDLELSLKLKEELGDIEKMLSLIKIFERDDFYIGSTAMIYNHFLVFKHKFFVKTMQEYTQTEFNQYGYSDLGNIINWEQPIDKIFKGLLSIVDKNHNFYTLILNIGMVDIRADEMFSWFIEFYSGFTFNVKEGTFENFKLNDLKLFIGKRSSVEIPIDTITYMVESCHELILDFIKKAYILSSKIE